MTTRCNLDCSFCGRDEYAQSYHLRDVPFDEIAKLEPLIANAERILLCGYGEPLLHKDFNRILEFIFARNPRAHLIDIVTNGTRFDRSLAERLIGRLGAVMVSLNAADAAGYVREMFPGRCATRPDLTARFQKTVDRTAEFLDALPKEDRARVELHAVHHLDNFTQMPALVALGASLGFGSVWLKHLTAFSLRDLDRVLLWCAHDFNRWADNAIAEGDRLGVPVHVRKFHVEPPQRMPAHKTCHAMWNDLVADVDGRFYPCTNGAGPIGDLREQPATSLWRTERYQALRAGVIFDSCTRCAAVLDLDDFGSNFGYRVTAHAPFADIISDVEAFARKWNAPVRLFKAQGLDLDQMRACWDGLGGDATAFEHMLTAFDPVSAARGAILSLARDHAPVLAASAWVMLGRPFAGFGWGAPSGSHVRPGWRRSGGSSVPATIFARLADGHSLTRILLRVTDVGDDKDLMRLQVHVNGAPLEMSQGWAPDGALVIHAWPGAPISGPDFLNIEITQGAARHMEEGWAFESVGLLVDGEFEAENRLALPTLRPPPGREAPALETRRSASALPSSQIIAALQGAPGDPFHLAELARRRDDGAKTYLLQRMISEVERRRAQSDDPGLAWHLAHLLKLAGQPLSAELADAAEYGRRLEPASFHPNRKPHLSEPVRPTEGAT